MFSSNFGLHGALRALQRFLDSKTFIQREMSMGLKSYLFQLIALANHGKKQPKSWNYLG